MGRYAAPRRGRPETATVTTTHGTALAVERGGFGPPAVIVGERSDGRGGLRSLAGLLADSFTVHRYEHRGGRAPAERDLEDLAAVIGHAGGSALVCGVASGGAVALDAAAAGLPIVDLALYEPALDLVSASVRDLAAIDVPTLVMVDAVCTPAVRAAATATADAVPGAEFRTLAAHGAEGGEGALAAALLDWFC